MGETDFHITVLLYLRQALRFLFRNDERVTLRPTCSSTTRKATPRSARI